MLSSDMGSSKRLYCQAKFVHSSIRTRTHTGNGVRWGPQALDSSMQQTRAAAEGFGSTSPRTHRMGPEFHGYREWRAFKTIGGESPLHNFLRKPGSHGISPTHIHNKAAIVAVVIALTVCAAVTVGD